MRVYNPFTTALTRTSLSVPMRELMNLCLFDLDSKCIDIVCGKGRNIIK